MVMRRWMVVLACLLWGCQRGDEIAQPQQLDARAWFVRASLDVRGIRPTADELARIAERPEDAGVMVSALVDDPRLGDRVRSIFASAFRTRKDYYDFAAYDLGLSEERDAELQRAIAEEVPALIAYVAVRGAPYTEILTADYTLVGPILTEIWPLEVLAEQPPDLPTGVVMARYTDGRPAAGVLAQNAIYWRHTSTLENANRGRTNALTRALLCEDYLDRPIDFPKDVNLTDSDKIHQAFKTNPGCLACHATLDPFASHLWGFMQTVDDDAYQLSRYHPENELMWQGNSDAPPAYFGTPTSGTLDGLAHAIAGDERFVMCAVRRVYQDLLGRPIALADEGQLAAHREAFLRGGLSLKALFDSVLHDPAYRGVAEDSEYGGRPEPVTMKLASPELLSSQLADLSGYAMTIEGRGATEVDFALRAFAGGSERGAAQTPSLGHALVHRRLAEAAARAVIDGRTPDARVSRWLANQDLGARPYYDTLRGLVREVRSRDADEAELGSLVALWDSVAASSDGVEAWNALLAALFADPDVALY